MTCSTAGIASHHAGADLPEAQRNRLLRRVDWRFLLPLARVDRALCLADGDLREWPGLIAREVVLAGAPEAAGCDLVVASDPDGDALTRRHGKPASRRRLLRRIASPVSVGRTEHCRATSSRGVCARFGRTFPGRPRPSRTSGFPWPAVAPRLLPAASPCAAPLPAGLPAASFAPALRSAPGSACLGRCASWVASRGAGRGRGRPGVRRDRTAGLGRVESRRRAQGPRRHAPDRRPAHREQDCRPDFRRR